MGQCDIFARGNGRGGDGLRYQKLFGSIFEKINVSCNSYAKSVRGKMAENITLRTHLIGAVTDFCINSKLDIATNAAQIVDFIVRLAKYREEGDMLAPEVYLTNDISSVLKMLPLSMIFPIGTTTKAGEWVRTVLKKCAPLAKGGWLIYVNSKHGAQDLDYGLFRGENNPIAVPTDDIILRDTSSEFAIVKISQIVEDCVEVKSNSHGKHCIFLNHKEDTSAAPLASVENLIKVIVRNVPAAMSDPLVSYLSNLLGKAFKLSHGSLVAVTSGNRIPKFLSNDAIVLKNPIQFQDIVRSLQENRNSSDGEVSKAALVEGMFASDGIVVFDSRARLLGYNCFTSMPKSAIVIGGARRRAYAALEAKIGSGLCASFMQSQDGWTEYKDDGK
jgi:hypothetical protein